MSFLTTLLDISIPWPSAGPVLYMVTILLFANAMQRAGRWYHLRHIPGPRLAGWTSLWLTKQYLDKTSFIEVPTMADKYGVFPCADFDGLHYRTTKKDELKGRS